MNDDLDTILADQYHCAKRQLKLVKRLRKVFNYQKDLDLVEHQVHLRMIFFENMICDKRLLKKKHKIKKQTGDILSRKNIRTILKNVFTYSSLSYKMMTSYWEAYMSFWHIR